MRLTRNPAAYRTLLGIFDSVDDATKAISSIIGAGIIPAALEMMDQGIVAAVEAAFHFGFPLDAGAVLLIEVDGLEVGRRRRGAKRSSRSARRPAPAKSARPRPTKSACCLWKCRKQAFGAIGRLSPSYCTQDGVVPRTKLPHILAFITESGERHGIRIVNVFHAGDGNIHPILLFDERDADQVARVLAASDEILDEVHRPGRQRDGRARHRRRKDQLHGQTVHARRPGRDATRPRRLQPDRPLQPAQNAPHRRRLRHRTN